MSSETARPPAPEASPEALGATLVVVVGIGLRLAFLREFPTIPVSDFRALVEFGIRLRDGGLVAPGFGWVQFNPGLPLALSLLLRIFPSNPEETARAATAVVTGLMGLAPFLLWRPIVAFRWRLFAGLALALWPGQVFFSGVVAQENWALLPAVALACLGARGARVPGVSRPIAAGVLYAVACAMRQEMLVVLLPLVLPAAGVWPGRKGASRRLLLLAGSAGIPLLLLAAERHAASGRFALTTEHGGLGLLGSVVPGAADGWIDPKAFVAARRPELLRDRRALREAATGLALEEWRRRWRYNVFRAGVSSLRLLGDSDAEDLFWSVGAAEALPAERRGEADAFVARWRPLLRLELAAISGLFVASLILGARRRDPAILLLGAAVFLKVAVQAVVSPMGRLMVPAIALELLAIALAASSLGRVARRERLGFLGVAVAFAAALLLATPPLRALTRRKDEAPWPVHRFPLTIASGGFGECRVESGRLDSLEWRRAHLAFSSPGPAPFGSARVTCELPQAEGSLVLIVGGTPTPSAGRIVRVDADGRALSPRDPGSMASATQEFLLGEARSVAVEVLAARPDAGSIWFEIGTP
jgi:hypothetical protein